MWRPLHVSTVASSVVVFRVKNYHRPDFEHAQGFTSFSYRGYVIAVAILRHDESNSSMPAPPSQFVFLTAKEGGVAGVPTETK